MLGPVHEPGEQRDAVERHVGRRTGATGVEERRGPVHRDARRIGPLAGVDGGRPAHDERHPDAALGDVTLLADERPHERVALAAVVGAEHDDRVVGETLLVECVEDAADALVHRLDELAVLRDGPGVAVQQRERIDPVAVAPLDLVADLGVAGPFPRPVRGVPVDLHVERLVGVLLAHVVHGAVGDQLGVVAAQFDRGLALVEVLLADRVDVREVVHGAVEVPEEHIEADLQRAVPGQPTAVPLAEHRRAVAGVFQQRRQRRMVVRDAVAVGPRGERLLQAGGQPRRVAARVEREAHR